MTFFAVSCVAGESDGVADRSDIVCTLSHSSLYPQTITIDSLKFLDQWISSYLLVLIIVYWTHTASYYLLLPHLFITFSAQKKSYYYCVVAKVYKKYNIRGINGFTNGTKCVANSKQS